MYAAGEPEELWPLGDTTVFHFGIVRSLNRTRSSAFFKVGVQMGSQGHRSIRFQLTCKWRELDQRRRDSEQPGFPHRESPMT
jgi:hypothetical protein